MIRVLVADDQALVRGGLRKILEGEPDLEVVGEAGDGREAVDAAERSPPDLVLMDIRMPTLDGLAATRRITARPNPPRVLVLTTFGLDEYVYEALRAGASGFMLKDSPPEELIAAVRIVAGGDALLAPAVTRAVVEEFVRRSPAERTRSDPVERLTQREREVFDLLVRGLSNPEICERLVVSEATAKTHVARILQKLGLRDRVQAVIFAYESGLVAPGAGEGRTS
jgi:DNA-binding NarL/FixJ family response regulator